MKKESRNAIDEIISSVDSSTSKKKLDSLKRKIGKKHKLAQVISNSDLLESLKGAKREKLRRVLQVNPGRSLSGVSVIAIMAKPLPCPGRCIYCPGGKTSPKSYTGFEPAALRAKQNDFDAFKQVSARLSQLEASGHAPEKCELIIMGGTFNSAPLRYQSQFVKKAFDAFNGRKSGSLEAAIKANERAKHRVVGLTFETRPDWASREQLKALLGFGATRIELGVQTLDEKVLKRVKRGHGVAEVAAATRDCRDAFLKVCYHVMPGLFSNAKKDEEIFRRLFEDERFKPDMLKIYPCLVLPNTELFDLWKAGEFKPYSTEEAAKALASCKKRVPEYCRIMRIERDIPTNFLSAGVPHTNLRELVQARMKDKCRCIRCREPRAKKVDWPSVELVRRDYCASGGKESFLSFEDAKNNLILGFLRLRNTKHFWVEGAVPPAVPLRRPNGTPARQPHGHRPFDAAHEPEEQEAAGVRELHVYGEAVAIGAKSKAVQHKKLGSQLLKEAERIASREWGFNELRVLSGVGAREYYRKSGYGLSGDYMVKRL